MNAQFNDYEFSDMQGTLLAHRRIAEVLTDASDLARVLAVPVTLHTAGKLHLFARTN